MLSDAWIVLPAYGVSVAVFIHAFFPMNKLSNYLTNAVVVLSVIAVATKSIAAVESEPTELPIPLLYTPIILLLAASTVREFVRNVKG